MDIDLAGEAALEMEKVAHALHHAHALVVAVDRARAALELRDSEWYSPLRTLVELAQVSAGRVQEVLEGASRRSAS